MQQGVGKRDAAHFPQTSVGVERIQERGAGTWRTDCHECAVGGGTLAHVMLQCGRAHGLCVGFREEQEGAEARCGPLLAVCFGLPPVPARGQAAQAVGTGRCAERQAVGEYASAVGDTASGGLVQLPEAIAHRAGQFAACTIACDETQGGQVFAANLLGPIALEHQRRRGDLQPDGTACRLAVLGGNGVADRIKEAVIGTCGQFLGRGVQAEGNFETALGIRDALAGDGDVGFARGVPHAAVDGPLHTAAGHRHPGIGCGPPVQAHAVTGCVVPDRLCNLRGKGGALVLLHTERGMAVCLVLSRHAQAEITGQAAPGQGKFATEMPHFIDKYLHRLHFLAIGVDKSYLGLVGGGHVERIARLREHHAAEMHGLCRPVNGAVGEDVDASLGTDCVRAGTVTVETTCAGVHGRGVDVCAAYGHDAVHRAPDVNRKKSVRLGQTSPQAISFLVVGNQPALGQVGARPCIDHGHTLPTSVSRQEHGAHIAHAQDFGLAHPAIGHGFDNVQAGRIGGKGQGVALFPPKGRFAETAGQSHGSTGGVCRGLLGVSFRQFEMVAVVVGDTVEPQLHAAQISAVQAKGYGPSGQALVRIGDEVQLHARLFA